MINAPSSEIAPTGEHRLLKRGDLNLFEVERVDRTVIELSVRWDKTVLRVAHLAWGQGFCLARDGIDGEDRLVVGPSLMPEETQAFSLIGWGEIPVFRAPPGARIERADEGAGAPCDPSGDDAFSMRAERMREIPLRFGTHPCVRMGPLTVSARVVFAPLPARRGRRPEPALLASGVLALALLGASAAAARASEAPSPLLTSDLAEARRAALVGLVVRGRGDDGRGEPSSDALFTEGAVGFDDPSPADSSEEPDGAIGSAAGGDAPSEDYRRITHRRRSVRGVFATTCAGGHLAEGGLSPFTGRLLPGCGAMGSRVAMGGRLPSTPRVASVAVRGADEQARVRRGAARRLPDVFRCREAGVTQGVALPSRVTVTFVIGPDGTPRAASAGPRSAGTVAECIARVARGWRFSPSQGEVTARVSFVWPGTRLAVHRPAR